MIRKDPTDFRIHAICVVKNEADIIECCLRAASTWCDRVIVYDGESTDGTWEKVQALASERIIPWRQDGKVFQESLRAEVFNAFRNGSRPGDWWCHLDADEFYFTDPRSFLATVPWPFHVVWGIAIEFYLTDADLSLPDDQPMEERLAALRYYSVENSEPRFFRDRKRLVWSEDRGWPSNMGPVYQRRILYGHYKYRSPAQIQKRLDTRRQSVERGFPGWQHAIQNSWREKIVPASKLKERVGDGFEYSEPHLPNHLEPVGKRMAKRLLHQLNLLP
jgi:glycosyltransferase involved in cell wall biosynthesis